MNPIELSRQFGFSTAFLLPNTAYESWTRHRNGGAFHSNADSVTGDPEHAYPWANACLLCVRAYTPFDDPKVVPAYYIASNAAYQEMTRLLERLRIMGVRAERAETPYRTQLLAAGIGTRMDNQLWYYLPYGTYTVLMGAMLALPEPVAYTPPHANAPVCDHCGACEAACFGALKGGAFDWQSCLRAYMENRPLPERFLPVLDAFSGCERCQRACPKNPTERQEVPEAVQKALDPVEILKGNLRPALALLGKNRKKPLIRQAIVLAANRGRTDALPHLAALREKTGDLYEVELKYAITLLQKRGSMVK